MKIQQELCPVCVGWGDAWEWPTERDTERLEPDTGDRGHCLVICQWDSDGVTLHYVTHHTHHVDTRDIDGEPGDHGGTAGHHHTDGVHHGPSSYPLENFVLIVMLLWTIIRYYHLIV